MQIVKDHTLNNNQYELLFEDINFVGGLLALIALKSGIKVALSFTRNLKTIYQPELSNYYPHSLAQTPAALKDFQFLMKCSSLFPHLFFPQRVLHLLNNTKLNSGFTLGVDKLLGRDRESSTLPIRTEKYAEYNAFSPNYKQANLLYEYLFDQNQATLELLVKCIAEGAQVVSTLTNVDAKVKLECSDVNSATVFISLPESTLSYKNPIRVSTLNFDLVLLSLQHKSLLQLHLNNTKLAGIDFQKVVSAELYKLGISTSTEMQSYLNEYHAKMNSEPEKDKNSIADLGLSNLRSTFDSHLKSTSVLLGKKLKSEVVFSKHSNTSMNGENFRIIQNECDGKFDLAKQTGIEYKHFLALFYRYRNDIDILINNAYELMEQYRNPQKIWTEVEAQFQRKKYSPFNFF